MSRAELQPDENGTVRSISYSTRERGSLGGTPAQFLLTWKRLSSSPGKGRALFSTCHRKRAQS